MAPIPAEAVPDKGTGSTARPARQKCWLALRSGKSSHKHWACPAARKHHSPDSAWGNCRCHPPRCRSRGKSPAHSRWSSARLVTIRCRIVGIQFRQPLFRGFNLRPAHIARSENHLALQIREIHHVEIHNAQMRPLPPRPDRAPAARPSRPCQSSARSRLLQLELPLHAHFGHDQVAAIAQNFFVRKRRAACSPAGAVIPVFVAMSISPGLATYTSENRSARSSAARPAGNRRHNADRVAVLHLRFFLLRDSECLRRSNKHSRSCASVHRRRRDVSQFRKLRRQRRQAPRPPCRLQFHAVLLARIGPQRRWNHHFDGHPNFPLAAERFQR